MKTTLGAGLIVLWCVSLPLLACLRVQTWGDEASLWASASFFAPQKLRPEAELGRVAALHGDLEGAVDHYRTVIAYWEYGGRPSHERVGCAIAAQNLATLYQRMEQPAQAAAWGAYACRVR